MAYPIDLKEAAIKLRRAGLSVREIAKKLNISVGTSSLWTSKIELDVQVIDALKNKVIAGRQRAIQERWKVRGLFKKELEISATDGLKRISFNKDLYKLMCAIFFWTEGGKYSDSLVYFINSDPIMVQTFLKLLRKSFPIDEKRLRALIHIHEYHTEKEIKAFWSKNTKIPLTQFSKSYLKPHTKKRIREGYLGSIRIRYYDS